MKTDEERLSDIRKKIGPELLRYKRDMQKQAEDLQIVIKKIKDDAKDAAMTHISKKMAVDHVLSLVSIVYRERTTGEEAQTITYSPELVDELLESGNTFSLDELDEEESSPKAPAKKKTSK